MCWWIQNLGIDAFALQCQFLLLSSLWTLFSSQVFGSGRPFMGGTHRHKEMILWAFFWAQAQFFKIPFEPLRSQQPTLVNITKKLAVPGAVPGARLLVCQACRQPHPLGTETGGILRRLEQTEVASWIITV